MNNSVLIVCVLLAAVNFALGFSAGQKSKIDECTKTEVIGKTYEH